MGAKMNFMTAMAIAEAGFDAWAAKEHNKKWVARIDGTPIRNDLLVNIAEAMVGHAEAREGECDQMQPPLSAEGRLTR